MATEGMFETTRITIDRAIKLLSAIHPANKIKDNLDYLFAAQNLITCAIKKLRAYEKERR
ncbi:MAG TPA: hypothetical protein HA282_05365 [Nanoarchaeota archaeon]|nr:MAG: hypothetical protein QT01_C0001G0156 [archaeon GW2011_AR6]MBS3082933.1 hypothetical protein [Candidatus Pacearchaeota archaeon]HIH17582.1 hypothetical protein [Nanoarchaeota archaeon]HIH33890.1 hypothetical protein [Nanoarchaeota archaeon]HIH51095.1 hypothetical protein [Nanoarchaeota archaeon]